MSIVRIAMRNFGSIDLNLFRVVTRWRQRILATLAILLGFAVQPGVLAFEMNPVPDAATQTSQIRQYVDFKLRQKQLDTTARFRPLTPDERAEFESLKPKIHKIWNYYYFSKARDSFTQRADTLFKDEFGPAHGQWVEDLFPTAQQVGADYPDQTDRMIALIVMRDELLGYNGGWRQGKFVAYDQAIKAIQDEERRNGVKLGDDGFTAEQRMLVWHATDKTLYDASGLEFRHQLFAKFIPGEVAKRRPPAPTGVPRHA